MSLLKFSGVYTATYVSPKYWPGLCFGDLQREGYLTKSHQKGWSDDCYDIVWTVVGDIEFTDTHGNHWKQGDKIVWEA